MSLMDDILTFWFEDPTGVTATSRKVWFAKKPAFDAEIRDRFWVAYEQAAAGQFDTWQATASGCLALVLLLDQFPRHLFRRQPQAFATDAKALAVAEGAIARGFAQTLPLIQRWFLYIPFMHSEDLAMQQRSVELFQELAHDPATQSAYTYALRHRAVIEQFGRFPHRNVILERQNTPDETEFLKQPGSSF